MKLFSSGKNQAAIMRSFPVGWQAKRIDAFAKVVSGATPWRQKYTDFFYSGNIHWLKTGDLNNGAIYDSEEKITEAAIKATSCVILPENTVLLAMYGGFKQIGRTGLLKIKAATNQAISAILHDESEIKSAYLQCWLNFNVDYWRKVAASSRKDPNITKKDIDSFIVLYPTIKEQDLIVSILDCWEKALGNIKKQIKLKNELKQGLMQQLVTGKKRFKEFIESTARRETPYGKIPLDWEYPSMREIAEEVSERNSNGKEITVLSCTKYDGLVSSQEYFGKRVFSKDTSDYKIVKRRQFAYATNHIEEGSIGLLENFEEGLVSPMYTVFKTRPDVHPPFLFKLFKTELYRHIFEVNTSASVDRRGSLRWKQFSSIHVPLPSFGEQVKISDYIELHDKEISLMQKQLDLLNSQKTGLMQKLLTGQVR